MGRVEKFKQARLTRRKYIFSALAAFSMFLVAVCMVDYSNNHLLKDEDKIELVTVTNAGNSLYEISVLNKKLYINTAYISRDAGNIRNKLANLIHFKKSS